MKINCSQKKKMKLIFVVLLLGAIAAHSRYAYHKEPRVRPVIRKIFIFHHTMRRTYRQANRFCRNRYGPRARLAIPNSLRENMKLRRLYRRGGARKGWIGLKFYGVPRKLRNSYGVYHENPFRYYANSIGNRRCLFMKRNGRWVTRRCRIRRPFICQVILWRRKTPLRCHGWRRVIDSNNVKHCIKAFKPTGGRTWTQARRICRRKNINNNFKFFRPNLGVARLIIPKDTIVNQAVKTELSSKSINKAFLGISDRRNEGVFRGVDRRAITFTDWFGGNPNNSGNEDCVEMNVNQNGWNDKECHHPRAFVCEVKQILLY